MNPDIAKGFVLVPTLGRATTILPRLVKSIVDTGVTTPGYILVEFGDYKDNKEAYDEVIRVAPQNWAIGFVNGGSTAASISEAMGAWFTDETDFVIWLSDDSVCETPGWDRKLISQLNGYNVVSTDDGYLAPKRANGALCYSAGFVRAVGGLYPAGCAHFYLDDLIECIGHYTGAWTVDMEIMIRHLHVTKGGLNDGTTAKARGFFDADTRAFARWKQHQMIPALERVLGLMERSGVRMIRPDLKGVSLMIASPAGDGRFDRVFMASLMETEKLLTQYGATVHFADMSYCSDIALARNRLMSAFIRGEDTHCLWVDSDQGWRAQDVVALLLANKDFVAVAGIRKTREPSFAVNVSDDFGNPTPIRLDPSTGFLEASAVGMAFALVTKACAVRMAQVYADLTYITADRLEEVGLFNPMVVNRRYFSEDFAFCHRWTHAPINGRIYVASGISLKHVGTHVWEGAWSDLLNAQMREQAA